MLWGLTPLLPVLSQAAHELSDPSSPLTFTITSAAPQFGVFFAGGTYNGSPFPAMDSICGVDNIDRTSLEGIPLTYVYYAGSSVSGSGTSTAPVAAGTYTAVAAFAGSADYLPVHDSPHTFAIFKATPTIIVHDAGGTYNGAPFPATAQLTGADGISVSSLEGVSPTFAYCVAPASQGTPLDAAPSTRGVYTVVASFPGSTDYKAGQSRPLTFTIT